MPRSGSGIYSTPPGTQGVQDQTIDSGKYNTYLADIELDLNTARPIIAGGTGAGNAIDARHNLGAEVSATPVPNLDSHVWESGSFWNGGGVGSGSPTNSFGAGIAYTYPQSDYVGAVEFRDFSTGVKYSRWMRAGVWQPWKIDDGSDKVSKSGDTMSGTLGVQGDFLVNGTVSTGPSIELGAQRLSSGAAFIDFHSVAPGTDFEARIIRDAGLNGDFSITNGGNGVITLYNAGTGPIRSVVGGVERVRVHYLASNSGANVLSMNGTNVGTSLCGFIGASADTNLYHYAAASHRFSIGGNEKAFLDANTFSCAPKISGGTGIEIVGDFSYLGGYNSGGGIHPAVGKTGVAIGWNASNGNGETNFWNCYTSGTGRSFSFEQLHADGTWTELAYIAPTGSLWMPSNIDCGGELKSFSGVLRMDSTGGAYLQYVPGTGTWNLGAGGYFNFLSQNVSVAGNVIAGGDLVSNHGYVSSVAPAGSNCHFVCYDETNAPRGYFYWERATDSVKVFHPNGSNGISLMSDGGVQLAKGLRSKQGSDGAWSGNVHNFEWVPATGVRMWVDNVNSGIIAIVCDHRIKKDIEPLPSMWDKVKALNPISYTPAEYGELWPASDEVRWGLVAHEVQEALIPSAASGVKDGEELQSPNTLAIIAALTKALQEAMQRIEALEEAAR